MARLFSNNLRYGVEVKPKSGRKYFTTMELCKILVQPESLFLELIPIGYDSNKHDNKYLEPTYMLVDCSKIWKDESFSNFRFPAVKGDVLILSRNELEEFYLTDKESIIDHLAEKVLKYGK